MEGIENPDRIFELIFTTCDEEIRSGQVRAKALMDHFLKYCESLDSYATDEISRVLDPSKDNRFLDLDTFKRMGPRIMGIITSHNETPSISQSQSHNESSLQLLDPSAMDASFGSIVGEGMDSTGSCQEDVSDLRFRNSRLIQEKKDLQKEHRHSPSREIDGMNRKMSEENAVLRKELREARKSINALQLKNDELLGLQDSSLELSNGSGIRNSSEKMLILKSRYEEVLTENKRLTEELEDVNSSLIQAQNEAKRKGKSVFDLTYEIELVKHDLDERSKSFIELENSHKKTQSANESLKAINEKLQFQIDKLSGSISCLEDELKNASLSQFMKLMGDTNEVSFDANDALWTDLNNKDNMPQNMSQFFDNRLSRGPYEITSTPCLFGLSKGRCSISDEFKKEGVFGAPMIDKNTDPSEYETNEVKTSITTDIFTSSPNADKENEKIKLDKSHLDINKNVQNGEIFSPHAPDHRLHHHMKREEKGTQTEVESTDGLEEVSQLLDSIIDQVVVSSPSNEEKSCTTELVPVKKGPLTTPMMRPTFDLCFLRNCLLFFLCLCVFYTFFGCVQIGGRTLYPMTWSSLFPEPFVLIRELPRSYPQVW